MTAQAEVTLPAAVTDAALPLDPVLSACGVGVVIDGATLLDGVDFEARPGEVHALIGPNGAGKSTLLGVLAGDRAATSGSVQVQGRPIGSWRLRELARTRAVLLQQHDVFFPFTAGAVVAMGRAPWRGTPAEDDDERLIAAAVAETDVVHLTARTVPSLSGGERARVALARVLAQAAPTLLLDEPTAALDLRHQEDVLRIARSRSRAGDTVVVVLHDLNLAAAYADRITLLAGGRLVASGSPDAVLTAERITEVYGQAVEVIPHPRTGAPLILPLR
ncbi:heme ABC transporter ATP-binding protein [Leifsonia sp. Leaf264]|uniref:heme ABC transporter ATP-binding protein n=1 Tax=Leifsonia sp. Leaf264 TaxID=1736314 RepID=UPI0009EC034C|nr:heme ABC transporter ATP-binding protein [Leifsonia sp. Leaf264]